MIAFKLNGKTVEGEEGQYILQVAEKYGIEIPTLCHHKALEPAGMCRLCTVELFDGRRTRFVTACNYPIWEGMEVKTDSEAVHSGRKLIVELLLARCPEVPLLQRLAKEYGIEETRFKKEEDTCILCGLCTRTCERIGANAISLTGRGIDIKVSTPFEINTEACIACGACASVCPTNHITLGKVNKEYTKLEALPIPSEYDMGLKGRKPIYVPYAQAVPNIPAIDRDTCIHFKTGGCKICTTFCGVEAIDHSMQDETLELNVGAIILTPGFEPFDPSKFDTYNYTKHPNVITSMEMERILSASGPTSGHLIRPSDHTEPKKIAWFQCVGSRDLNRCDNAYCSSVCCMYAIKEAVISKEHTGDNLDCAIFFMDMRTHGKDFERFYDNAREKHGVRFIRSRVHTIDPIGDSGNLSVRYMTENGQLKTETFDMIVLSVGLQTAPKVVELADRLGLELTEGNFCKTATFDPVATSKEGIFACGAFTGPKDIPQTVMEASAAACAATENLAAVRNTQTKTVEMPAQRDVTREAPRIGVFVCNCGINIGGTVRVPEVVEYAKSLPEVVYVEENLFTCSQDTQDKITEVIRKKNLNRVVVAACTPITHETLFQETLINAGLNKYLFEMANIRNQDSWVHAFNPDAATKKAKDLVRMAVAKVALLNPLLQTELPVNHRALVVGGGVAGMTAALSLARQGYAVHLVEKSEQFGGNARNLNKTYRDEDIGIFLTDLIRQVEAEPRITVHRETTVRSVEGFIGNFKSVISNGSATETVDHGVAILATGAREYRPQEYLYGENTAVVTHLEMDELLRNNDLRLQKAGNVIFIQCVGSRDEEHPYCSKVCCTHSIKSALELKNRNPNLNVYILYRDIRTYGEREDLYREARSRGILFFRYDPAEKPEVVASGKRVTVGFKDPIVGRKLEVSADILCLATAIVPREDLSLARLFKVPVDGDGWMLEAHQKLRPVEFATEGVFLCGMTHYPKPIEESIAQARAAAAKALTVLTRDNIMMGGIVSSINPELCSGCLGCINVCPYGAITYNEEKRIAQVNQALCKGCGACAAACPSEASVLMGFSNKQLYAQIKSAMSA